MTRRRSRALVACLAAAATLAAGAGAFGQLKDTLFPGVEKFSKGASDATDVTLDKNMLGMAGAMGGQMAYFAGRLNSIVVHDYEYPHAGMYDMADVEAVERRLSAPGWNHIVHEHSSTEVTDICVKVDSEGQWTEMAIVDAEPTELNFIHLEGHVSMADLKHLGGLGAAAGDPKLKTRPH